MYGWVRINSRRFGHRAHYDGTSGFDPCELVYAPKSASPRGSCEAVRSLWSNRSSKNTNATPSSTPRGADTRITCPTLGFVASPGAIAGETSRTAPVDG